MASRIKKTFAEFIGTLFYILIGCGSIMALKTDYKNGSAYLIVALAFSAVYAVVYHMFSESCDAHFNPAVSLSSLILGDISFPDFIFYIVGQLSGAFAACGLLFGIFYGHTGTFGASEVYDDSTWLSLLIEFLLSIIFIYARISAEHSDKRKAGIISALALFAVNALGIQLTLASCNPARSFACAIFAGGEHLLNVWPFILGPFLASLASVIIALIYNIERKYKEKKNENSLPDNNLTDTSDGIADAQKTEN